MVIVKGMIRFRNFIYITIWYFQSVWCNFKVVKFHFWNLSFKMFFLFRCNIYKTEMINPICRLFVRSFANSGCIGIEFFNKKISLNCSPRHVECSFDETRWDLFANVQKNSENYGSSQKKSLERSSGYVECNFENSSFTWTCLLFELGATLLVPYGAYVFLKFSAISFSSQFWLSVKENVTSLLRFLLGFLLQYCFVPILGLVFLNGWVVPVGMVRNLGKVVNWC